MAEDLTSYLTEAAFNMERGEYGITFSTDGRISPRRTYQTLHDIIRREHLPLSIQQSGESIVLAPKSICSKHVLSLNSAFGVLALRRLQAMDDYTDRTKCAEVAVKVRAPRGSRLRATSGPVSSYWRFVQRSVSLDSGLLG